MVAMMESFSFHFWETLVVPVGSMRVRGGVYRYSQCYDSSTRQAEPVLKPLSEQDTFLPL